MKILIYAEAFHGCPFVYRNESDSVARIGRTPVEEKLMKHLVLVFSPSLQRHLRRSPKSSKCVFVLARRT
jgi:hypothetical protein